MTSYEFGDVVLVEFSYRGAKKSKKRPALVILDTGDDDAVLAPITTKKRTAIGDYQVKDWQASGLLKPSWIRLAKVSCLHKGDIIRKLGKLPDIERRTITAAWKNLYVMVSN